MMRDAKGRFCKKGSNKNTQAKKARPAVGSGCNKSDWDEFCKKHGIAEDVDWGSEKECCCKKTVKTSKKDREENTELLKSVMELLLDIGESMARTNDNPETLEEMQETIIAKKPNTVKRIIKQMNNILAAHLVRVFNLERISYKVQAIITAPLTNTDVVDDAKTIITKKWIIKT